MTKNYYDLLGVEASAEPEEIKRAFRREIARYHPDKVQHLGPEFQEIASTRAAALTEAYRILMDQEARRGYDTRTAKGGQTPAPSATQQAARRPAASADPDPDADQRPDSRIRQAQATTSDFVKKATLRMLRDAISRVANGVTELPAEGFDAAYVVTGKRAIFGRKESAIRLLARFVPYVDAAAVEEAWPLAVRATAKDQDACALLLGVGLAPSKVLAAAVTGQRRKTRTAGPVLVPVDVRDWDALLPPEVPASVRAILQALREFRR